MDKKLFQEILYKQEFAGLQPFLSPPERGKKKNVMCTHYEGVSLLRSAETVC